MGSYVKNASKTIQTSNFPIKLQPHCVHLVSNKQREKTPGKIQLVCAWLVSLCGQEQPGLNEVGIIFSANALMRKQQISLVLI